MDRCIGLAFSAGGTRYPLCSVAICVFQACPVTPPACSASCIVNNCSRITDCLLLPSARLDGVIVERATVLSAPGDASVIEGGAVVRDALLQWGSHVDTMACVDNAVR